MDMDDILEALFVAAVEESAAYKGMLQQDLETTQPHFDRLCQALGDEEAGRLWVALASVGAAQQVYAFRSGLCLGLRLMALCL